MGKLVFYGGRIYPILGDEAEVLVVEDDKIIDVGDNSLLEKYKDYEHVNLSGAFLMPSFHDTHTHVVAYGNTLLSADLSSALSVDEICEWTSSFLKQHPRNEGSWLFGRGWDQNHFTKGEKRFPNRYDLDKISTEVPILLIRTCGHVGIVNSLALELVGVNSTTFIEGGEIELDKNGEPLGIFKEASLEWFKKNMVPKPSVEDIKKAIVSGTEALLPYGITCIHTEDSYDLGYSGEFKDILKAYKELISDNKLRMRIYQKVSLPKKEDLLNFLDSIPLRTGDSIGLYTMGPMKQWLDGTLGARTAALIEGYADDPLNKGILVYSLEELTENLDIALQNKMQICIHCIGDRALQTCLEAYEETLPKAQWNSRPRIVHAQVGNHELYKKLAELNVSINIQPIQTSTDIHMMFDRLGSEREKRAHNWRTLEDLGVNITGSSDIPVEDPNVFMGVHAVVNRKNVFDNPPEPWLPEQAVSLHEALCMYTINSAYSAFMDEELGSLEKGKKADFVILDVDPFSIEKSELKHVKVLSTYLDGQLVYSRKRE